MAQPAFQHVFTSFERPSTNATERPLIDQED
jgi:hypothetical protein